VLVGAGLSVDAIKAESSRVGQKPDFTALGSSLNIGPYFRFCGVRVEARSSKRQRRWEGHSLFERAPGSLVQLCGASSMLTVLSEPHLVAVICAIVGGLFLVSGITKLRDTRRFTDIVRAYQLLPAPVTPLVGRLLPWVELLAGAALIAGVGLPVSSLIAAALLVAFAVAVGINILRGRHELACGCFGLDARRRLSWTMVLRNLGLAALVAGSAASPMSGASTALSLGDGLLTRLIAGGALIIVLLVSAAWSVWPSAVVEET
jgi:uncharacterized membrane protein YphA (DoxX/SURF4 family)